MRFSQAKTLVSIITFKERGDQCATMCVDSIEIDYVTCGENSIVNGYSIVCRLSFVSTRV